MNQCFAIEEKIQKKSHSITSERNYQDRNLFQHQKCNVFRIKMEIKIQSLQKSNKCSSLKLIHNFKVICRESKTLNLFESV